MELRSKSRTKRASSASQRTNSTPTEPSSSKAHSSHNQSGSVTVPLTEGDLEPKRIKFQSPKSNITRRTLRHKLQREKSVSPRNVSPKTRARPGSVRSQRGAAPTSTAVKNRTGLSQIVAASSERPNSAALVAAAESIRPKREISFTRGPLRPFEKRNERAKPEAARPRASQLKERGSAKRSSEREIERAADSAPRASPLAGLRPDEAQLERDGKPELVSLENRSFDEEIQDQIERNRNASVAYEEPFGHQLQFSEEASQPSLADSENFFGFGLNEALQTLDENPGPVAQLAALQSLAEGLSIASEEFFGLLRAQSVVATLTRVIKGSFGTLDDDTFMSLSSAGILDESNDSVLLACRCLCNLLEASPNCVEIIKATDAVKSIMPHLRYLRSVELGEQIIQLLLLVSKVSPATVAEERGISALVKFLDFFSTPVQRTAILAAANCCCALGPDQVSEAAEALTVISGTLGSPDAIVVENSCLLVKNLVARLHDHSIALENLFSESFVLRMLELLEPGLEARIPPEPNYVSLMTLASILAETSGALAAILLQERMLLILKHNLSGSQSSPKLREAGLSLACKLLPKLGGRRQTFEAAIDRTLSLKFAQLMAPAALKLCRGSALPQIKLLTLALLLKLALFASAEVNEVFTGISLIRFLFGLIWTSPGSIYAVRALQISLVLLEKAPNLYAPLLVREGIPAAIAKLPLELQDAGSRPGAKPRLSSLEAIWTFFSHTEASLGFSLGGQAGLLKDSGYQKLYATLAQALSRKLSLMADLYPRKSILSGEFKASFSALSSKFGQLSTRKCLASLKLLRDLLKLGDVTTHELASLGFGACFDHFLGSDTLNLPKVERQKLFFNSFLADGDLSALQNLIQHLNTRLEQIETYPLILFSQVDEFSTSRLLQLCQLRATAGRGLPECTVVITVQLMASFSLVAQHLRKAVSVLKSGTEIEFYYEDQCLDGTGTVLQALLRAGLPLDSLRANRDPISITYHPITPKPSSRLASDAGLADESEELSAILRVLQVIHVMANKWVTKDHWKDLPKLPQELFINEKLTGKLDRQLQEAALVVGKCLPAWCEYLVTNFPFLFPFSTRLEYFQATALGSDRFITKHMLAEARRDGAGSFGRMAKLKVLVSRSCIVESAMELAATHPQDRAILEIQFSEEVGSGQGPTLEYFSCVFREFCKRSLGLWREAHPSDSEFVNVQFGLFPKPCISSDPESLRERAVWRRFRTLGWITAKSLFDNRITDLPLSEAFLELLVGGVVKLERLSALRLIRTFDPRFADSLASLGETVSGEAIDALALSFVLPGTQLELIAKGSSTPVTKDNLDAFVDATLDLLTNSGVRYAVSAFEEGFNQLFPLRKLAIFTPRELAAMLGNGEEDWAPEVILSAIKAEHGYTLESLAIRRFVTVASHLEPELRQDLLQFITGSRKLPIGGFRALTPNLTIVQKHCVPPLCPDNYLPSVNTCFNYLKLPDYSCEAVMKASFLTAMREGNLSFHLS